MTLDRRTFLGAAAPLAAASATPSLLGSSRSSADLRGEPFELLYAPHFGMFRQHGGDDLIDQLSFMHDEGFRALEDNGMPRREPALQERIGQALADKGMQMGVFVAHADFRNVTFASSDAEQRDRIEADMRAACEVARRVGARWCTVVPGAYAKNLEWDYQTANVVDNLRRAADICGEAELTMVLEPLNPWRDHPGLFLTKMPQAFAICRAVDSPWCKILDDLYHQQITEGNLIPNIDLSWSEIAYFQIGDNPGRKEPTTGEINYATIFRHLKNKGFTGVVGMEHGNSRPGKEGERAVIDAYRQCDPRD